MKFRKVYRPTPHGDRRKVLAMRNIFTRIEGPISVEEVYYAEGLFKRNAKRYVHDTWKVVYITAGLKCDLDWNGGMDEAP